MPYIKPEYRDFYDDEITHLILMLQQNKQPGELNYIITKLCNGFLAGRHYADFNEVIGVLECSKLELYRRLVQPAEEQAMKKNGDVYDV